MHLNLKHNVIGPFQFLIFSLVLSKSLLVCWMSGIDPENSMERIIVGAFSITVLIAVLVIFCVIYWIKKTHNDFDNCS